MSIISKALDHLQHGRYEEIEGELNSILKGFKFCNRQIESLKDRVEQLTSEVFDLRNQVLDHVGRNNTLSNRMEQYQLQMNQQLSNSGARHQRELEDLVTENVRLQKELRVAKVEIVNLKK